MRAGWTAYGACTSGSTAPPKGAMRPASGGAAATSTRASLNTKARQKTAALERSADITMLISSSGRFVQVPFDSEAEIEKVVVQNSEYIFGPASIYLPKGKISTSDGVGTIPDGQGFTSPHHPKVLPMY